MQSMPVESFPGGTEPRLWGLQPWGAVEPELELQEDQEDWGGEGFLPWRSLRRKEPSIDLGGGVRAERPGVVLADPSEQQ